MNQNVSQKEHLKIVKELEVNKQLLTEESRAKGILRFENEQLKIAVQELNNRLILYVRMDEDRINYDRILEEENMKEEDLKNSIIELRILLRNEREKSERLQKQLQETAQELEDVTQSLFEEANQMVSEEARRRAAAEEECKRLREKMEEMGRRCEIESLQNQNLKEKLRNGDIFLSKSKELKSSSSSETINSANSLPLSRKIFKKTEGHLKPRRTSSSPLFDHSSGESDAGDAEDRGAASDINEEPHVEEEKVHQETISIPLVFPPSSLSEFAELLGDLDGEEILTGTLGEKIMEGEISPTLRFFCNKKNFGSKLLSSRSGLYLSNWRNLERALADNRCYIESVGMEREKHNCSACERQESLFKMRIQIPTHLIFNPNDSYAWSEWKYVCGSCRDRLVSVGDLYSFLRNARAGVIRKDLPSLYRQFLKLRIKISASRVLTL